jgi:teichuronic acid biosynthesis glycosyltransferase TuaG
LDLFDLAKTHRYSKSLSVNATKIYTKQGSTMQPSISVVIPFYHAEDFFDDAYQSIKQQTVQPQEIIVVNDGCGKKAENFLKKYNGITLINLKVNQGPSIARNTGAKKATSSLIAFLDADDLWLANKLEIQLAFLAEHPKFSACHTGITTFNNAGDIATFIDKPFDLDISDLLKSTHVTPRRCLSKKPF